VSSTFLLFEVVYSLLYGWADLDSDWDIYQEFS
jgi:hypothetical protein